MKITFIVPVVTQNGGNRVVAIYAEKLLAMGHDVRVIAQRPKAITGLEKLKKKSLGRSDPRSDLNRLVQFAALGARFAEVPFGNVLDAHLVPDGDVVIATWWRTAFSVAALPPQKGAKAYFVQGHEVHAHLPWDLSAGSYYLPLKKITIADWLVETMARLYGDTDVVKVENSVDVAHFNAPERPRNARPKVGLVYSPLSLKGVDTAVTAIETARQRHPDLEVLAFGSKAPTPELPLPAGTQFHTLPAQSDIPGLYAQCDAWLFSSRNEGFGLPLLEAMACRTPVVATRAGAAPDLIEEGVSGYLVDVEDGAAMGARLADLLALSADAWRAMSDAAHAKAHGYSWEDAAQAFEAALRTIADHG